MCSEREEEKMSGMIRAKTLWGLLHGDQTEVFRKD